MSESNVFNKFLEPILSTILNNPFSRSCKGLRDESFIRLGLLRVLGNDKSGRAFLQRASIENIADIEITHFFKTLKSKRRLLHLESIINDFSSRKREETNIKDPFSLFKELDKFDIYASDGSYFKWACHDPKFSKKTNDLKSEAAQDRIEKHESSKRSCQHFFSYNLRNRMAHHLTVAQIGGDKKKEHDMHALKRLSHEELRFNAAKKRKVLHVYDRAGMDFHQWDNWKMNSGIYFLTREKALNRLQVLGQPEFDMNDSVNVGVLTDEMVGTSNGVSFRRVVYKCPSTNNVYKFVTNLSFSIRPGLIVQLYKSRWEVEKLFDSFKNKLEEKKSWGSSETAKTMQAKFICLAYNLTDVLYLLIENESKVSYEYDKKRKAKNLKQKKEELKDAFISYPSTWDIFLGVSQITIKFYRWLRAYLSKNTSWLDAIAKLKVWYEDK